jgi:hypothetical protein
MSQPLPTGGAERRPPVLEKTGATAAGQAGPPAEALPSDAASADATPVPDGRAHRFWSARRVPAGVTALLLLLVTGAFLYDVAAVRAGRDGMAWRRELAAQLADRPLDDLWVLAGAGLAAALGLWLLLLALTPGLRGLLPMRRTHPAVRAGLHRPAAAIVLRDRAMEVAGVQAARVAMGRRRADVRAVSHFRELDDVRADLEAALTDAIGELGLARRPALKLRVRRPGRKG